MKLRKKIRRALDFIRYRTPEILLLMILPVLLVAPALIGKALASGASVFWTASRAGRLTARDYFVNVGSVVAALVGVLVISIICWVNRRPIWASARKMVIEAVSRRVIVGLMLFFVIVTPMMPFILETEGSPVSQVQITLTYSLLLAQILLSLIAVFLGLASMAEEIQYKEIHVTDVKPILRWQFLAGKWVGVMLITSALLYAMGGATYVLVRAVQDGSAERWAARIFGRKIIADKALTERDIALREAQRKQVYEQVFTARMSALPDLPQIDDAVERDLEERRKSGKIPEGMDVATARRLLKDLYLRRACTVAPQQARGWVVRGLRPTSDPDQYVFVRFEITAPTPQGQRTVPGRWLVKPPFENMGAYEVFSRAWVTNTYQEFKVPAAYIGQDGVLEIAFFNVQPIESNDVLKFDPKTGLEILQPVEGFFPNYFRALLVIQCHLALLAAVGIMAGSLLSFPVATLLVVSIFSIGLISGWLQQGFEENVVPTWQLLYEAQENIAEKPLVSGMAANIAKKTLLFILKALPDISEFSPISNTASGRLVSWFTVAQSVTVLLFIKGGIAAILAFLLFTRREIARVQV